MAVVLIGGIPGSGKTWLCRALTKKNIKCLDTDDIIQEIFGNPNAKDKTGISTVKKEIAKARKQGYLLVIVGITIDVIDLVDEYYFIKMTSWDLEVAYRRVLIREINKVLKHGKEAIKLIEEKSVNTVQQWIIHTVAPALPFFESFDWYSNLYRESLKHEKARGAMIVSPANIMKKLIHS